MRDNHSWTSLVAQTMGLSHDTIRARVSAPGHAPQRRCWLVVQTFAGRDRNRLDVARPFGAALRSVTGEELAGGVDVDVLALDSEDLDDPVVVAWVERRAVDLEFEGCGARPYRGAEVGHGRVSSSGVWTVAIGADRTRPLAA